jgi:hypothetical protein
MCIQWLRIWAFALLLTFTMGQPTRAELIYTVEDVGGGLFQYNFTLINRGFINPFTGMPEPLSGLNFIHAQSEFGLDETSTINAPAGWDFFAPLPPFIDELNYFSLSAASDIPIGDSLEGFSFQSTVGTTIYTPVTFPCDDYDVIGIISNGQLICVPEPASLILLLLGTGFIALISVSAR